MTYQPTAHDCPLCQLWMWCVVVGPSAHLKENSCAEQLKGTAPAAAFLKWRDGSRPSDLLQLGDLWSSRPLEKFETVSRSVTVSAMVPIQKFWFDTVNVVRRPSELLCCHEGFLDKRHLNYKLIIFIVFSHFLLSLQIIKSKPTICSDYRAHNRYQKIIH